MTPTFRDEKAIVESLVVVACGTPANIIGGYLEMTRIVENPMESLGAA
jgi:hypothetical protein